MASYRTVPIASILFLALIAPTASRASHEGTWGDWPLLAKAERSVSGWASFKFYYDGEGSGLLISLGRAKSGPDFRGSVLYDEDNELITGLMMHGGRLLGNEDCIGIYTSVWRSKGRCDSPSTLDSTFMKTYCTVVSPGPCAPGDHLYLGWIFEPGEDPAGIYKYLMWYGTPHPYTPWGWEVRGTGITLLGSDDGADVSVLTARDFDQATSARVSHSGVVASANVTPSTIEFDISERLIASVSGDGGVVDRVLGGGGVVDRMRLRGPGIDRFCACNYWQLVGPGARGAEYAPPGKYSLELSGARAGQWGTSSDAFVGLVDPRVP